MPTQARPPSGCSPVSQGLQVVWGSLLHFPVTEYTSPHQQVPVPIHQLVRECGWQGYPPLTEKNKLKACAFHRQDIRVPALIHEEGKASPLHAIQTAVLHPASSTKHWISVHGPALEVAARKKMNCLSRSCSPTGSTQHGEKADMERRPGFWLPGGSRTFPGP